MINMLWPNRYREQDKIKELKYWIDCYRYKQLHVKDFEVTPEDEDIIWEMGHICEQLGYAGAQKRIEKLNQKAHKLRRRAVQIAENIYKREKQNDI